VRPHSVRPLSGSPVHRRAQSRGKVKRARSRAKRTASAKIDPGSARHPHRVPENLPSAERELWDGTTFAWGYIAAASIYERHAASL
jgi:hypothetical protein